MEELSSLMSSPPPGGILNHHTVLRLLCSSFLNYQHITSRYFGTFGKDQSEHKQDIPKQSAILQDVSQTSKCKLCPAVCLWFYAAVPASVAPGEVPWGPIMIPLSQQWQYWYRYFPYSYVERLYFCIMMGTFSYQSWTLVLLSCSHWMDLMVIPDSKIHGANMGPIWGR